LAAPRHDIFPLFCASAEKNMGVERVMSFIDYVCPAPTEMPPQKTTAGGELPCNAKGPACIFIFKTIIEPHIGELSLFKVYSGTVRSGSELVNENTSVTEKLSQLFLMEGHNRVPVQELVAGDIGATIKLRSTHVNNTPQPRWVFPFFRKAKLTTHKSRRLVSDQRPIIVMFPPIFYVKFYHNGTNDFQMLKHFSGN